MSATGVTTLDHTVQETIVWLKAVEEELQLDSRQQAYNALRAVLKSQLPILLRGSYYENWHAAGTPTRERHASDFADHVAVQLSQQFSIEPLTVIRGSVRNRLGEGSIPANLRN